ncbi:3alpha(or 20beta)-hydroxysteroid dehydrogenase [Actinocorallia herbida]|uniref:3alpha(Or 20beta)-hydroxysteroid dehydrogenase n=1 Tax=Actinocorallia herbida TaxID=58109 RepID=A0A3N1CQA7_9ACTN|nr:glucose 1-dehydrogenase [Actinocorallia herbida]ROO83500.1 3alpha(or 20beta)-hydroxysteroid dehydrogenase [Actinocorallia herbida]
MGQLDGKVVLISGGARGMGKAHVRRLTSEGAKVVFGDVLEEEGAALAAEIGDSALFTRMDVTSPADWDTAVSLAVKTYGGLHGLINNAGVIKVKYIEDMEVAEFQRVLEINLVGQWLGVKAVIPAMREGGGAIVNVSSTEGFVSSAGYSAYSASKFGVRGLTKTAARELGKYNIRVNSIHPGGIFTAMSLDPDVVAEAAPKADAFLANLPLGRMGNTHEVSGLITYLVSDDSAYVTGAEIVIDGGMITGAGF